MKRKIILLIIFIISTTYFLSLLASSKTPDSNNRTSIHIRGSGAMISLIQNVAEAYMSENPNVIISVSGGGSLRGIKSLIDETSQIAMSSAEIDDELLLLSKEKDVNLVKNVVAYDAIVPFVNLDNPIGNLSLDELKKIYTSRVNNWKEIGGNDSPIILTTRNFNSGTYEAWKLLVIGEKAVISSKAMPLESTPMKDYIIKTKNGIGYSAFSYIDNNVKPLSVNGIKASIESIKKGTYPLRRELILYTRDDVSPETLKFIDYIRKITPQLSEKVGVFPLN